MLTTEWPGSSTSLTWCWRPSILATAGRALANVGDATSLALLLDIDARRRAAAIAHAAKHPSFSPEPWLKDPPVPRAIDRIRHRLGQRPYGR